MPRPNHPREGITTTSCLGLPSVSEEEVLEILSEDDAEGSITYEDGVMIDHSIDPIRYEELERDYETESEEENE
jgi:hypothetical protein